MAVRAAVMHEPGRLTVESFPEPDPAPGAVVLRMHYSGICGTDKHTWRGETLQYAGTEHEHTTPFPLICGHENVGVIEAVGAGDPPLDERAVPLAVGDRVVPAPNVTCGRCFFCIGGHPYYLCRAMEDYGNSLTCAAPPHLYGGWGQLLYLLPGTRLFRVPDDLPSELAALTEVMAVTHGLDASLRFGDTVLVLGVGPLGLMHLAKAELLGAGRLIALDALPERLELARAFGADLVLDASATTADERLAHVREETGGLGADVVVDCSGRAEPFSEALDLARPGGTVVEAGAFVDLGTIPLNPNRVVVRGLTVLGIGGEILEQYGPVLTMLARHRERLPFRAAITHRVPLEDVADALELSQTGAAMKVLVAPNGAV
jgi:threonine dehydrogenase-like Zn-dependent dehydrogenase